MAIGNVVYTPKRPLTNEDIVDNLLGTTGKLPLSDRQGKVLDEKMTKKNNIVLYDITGDILEQSLRCPNGFTVINIAATVTNLPNGNFLYSYGYIIKRVSDTLSVHVFDRITGDECVNTFYENSWTGWTKIITENNLKLQLIGSVTGRTALNVDTTKYEKFLVVVQKYGRAKMSAIVLSQELPASRAFSTYINPSNNICLSVNCTKTYFQVIQMWENNSGEINQIPDTVTLTVYGR